MSSTTERNAVEETQDGWVVFAIEVRVPMRQAPIVADALTGNDDDLILAAETAFRDRIEDAVLEDAESVGGDNRYAFDLNDRTEFAIPHESTVKTFLSDVMGPR